MAERKVKIKLFSDRRDTSTVTSVIKRIEVKDAEIVCQTPPEIKIEQNDIIIISVEKLNSKMLDALIAQKKVVKNKFIVVTRKDSALLVTSLIKIGFNDIFLFPHEIPRFTTHIAEIINNKTYLTLKETRDDSDLYNFKSLAGESEKFKAIIEIAKKVSENDKVSVLILGETGTGKGLLAKAIHKNSNSGDAPFIEIVCSAIPEDLLESELFGYEKGAFTNALYRKLGLFELAENGTLFLDEIGDLTFNLQVKLLRVIEKKVIRRLGSVEDIPVKTRIISATNRDLNKMVQKNLFRKDLFHRLNVVSILIPPLRERGNDIILLARKFVEEFNLLFGKSVNTFENGLIEFLLTYSWPGNVRELRNAIERSVLLNEDNVLRVSDFEILLQNLPLNILEKPEHIKFHPSLIRLDVAFKDTSLNKLSKLYAKAVLTKMGGNKSKSAGVLGISRPKLDKLLNNK